MVMMLTFCPLTQLWVRTQTITVPTFSKDDFNVLSYIKMGHLYACTVAYDPSGMTKWFKIQGPYLTSQWGQGEKPSQDYLKWTWKFSHTSQPPASLSFPHPWFLSSTHHIFGSHTVMLPVTLWIAVIWEEDRDGWMLAVVTSAVPTITSWLLFCHCHCVRQNGHGWLGLSTEMFVLLMCSRNSSLLTAKMYVRNILVFI